MLHGGSPAAFAARLTAKKLGMRGPLTGSTMTSESKDRPISSVLPVKIPATYKDTDWSTADEVITVAVGLRDAVAVCQGAIG